jgi:hypothetical protein
MISTVVVGTAALGAWLAAPFVAMARTGSIDDRHRAAVGIPVPRVAGHDAPARRSTLVGV